MSNRRVGPSRVWLVIACGALVEACGGGDGPATAASPLAADPSGTPAAPSTMPEAPNAGDGPAPAAEGATPPGSSNEGVDPDLGLTPGTDGVDGNGTSGATDGTDATDGTATDGNTEPGAMQPTPTEPTPTEPTPTEPPAEPAAPITLFLAGDSIVQTYADTASTTDQAGWGQMLAAYFDDSTTVINRAIGGRTARRFIDEGRLDDIVDELEAGDYLLVQFGTNDGNRTATYTLGDATIPYFLDPATDFRSYLQRYIDAARGRGANPVFVTPTPRNSAYCTGGNGTGAHAAAMSALGAEQGVPVVDLNARSVAYLREICPAPTPEDFFLLRADGTVDGTHFQENGARILAGFVADGLSAIGAPFPAHRSGAR